MVEVNDIVSNDYHGWAFGVEYDNFLNVEELFVLPQYRHQGLAKCFIEYLIKFAKQLKKPLRFWVPFVDSKDGNIEAILHIAKIYGFKISHSPVRWADYLMAHEVPSKEIKGHRFPTPGMVLPESNQIPFMNLADPSMDFEDFKKKKRPKAPAMAVDWIIYECGCCQPDGYLLCPNPRCEDPKPPKEPRQLCKKP